MKFLRTLSRLISGGQKEPTAKQSPPSASAFHPEDWTIEMVRKRGINPLVRNADDDYYAVSTDYVSENCLSRDCLKK